MLKNSSCFETVAKIATRSANGKLQRYGQKCSWLIGGDADIAVQKRNGFRRVFLQTIFRKNIHFGVDEHAMGAIANGIIVRFFQAIYGNILLC